MENNISTLTLCSDNQHQVPDSTEMEEMEESISTRVNSNTSTIMDINDVFERMLLKQKTTIIIIVSIMVVTAVTFTGIGFAEIMSNKRSSITTSDKEERTPSIPPSHAPSTIYESLINDIFIEVLGEETMTFQEGSNQWKSRKWMIDEDPLKFDVSIEKYDVIQRFALINIYFSFGGVSANGIDYLEKHECESNIISCNDNGKIRSMLFGKLEIMSLNNRKSRYNS